MKTTFVPFLIIFGTELTLPIRLPSCPQCVQTIGRLAPSLTSFALLTVLIFLVALFPSWAITGLFMETGRHRVDLTGWFSIGMAAIGPALWYRVFRHPRNGQTTAFQPIRLVGVRRKWFIGDISQVTLKFTNDAYRASFAERNQEILQSNAVRVR